jgi:hypothetical protein
MSTGLWLQAALGWALALALVLALFAGADQLSGPDEPQEGA